VKKKMMIEQADITTLKVDAIVNAANESLLGGGGVDGAIHKAAGPELLEATKKLDGAETGEAKITKGFKLPAEYIIHTVGPVYHDGQEDEAERLAACYEHSLKLADEYKLETIAFPSISTGVYNYPLEEAAEIAVATVTKILNQTDSVKEVIFVVFDVDNQRMYEKMFEKFGIQHS
jgi:O-acetyl-ADP-ribose deacetylase (regulator of RNase III)